MIKTIIAVRLREISNKAASYGGCCDCERGKGCLHRMLDISKDIEEIITILISGEKPVMDLAKPVNEQRAYKASVALEAYAQHVYELPLEEIRKHNVFDLRELCQDLISDILHFANQDGMDVESISASADLNYEEEVYQV